MQAVEFETDIKNGIVRIPKEYKELQYKKNVKLLIVYVDNKNKNSFKRKKMSAISIDTKEFKFNREEAHEI